MNKVRISELNCLKLEAEQKIAYIKDYVKGKDFCAVINEHKLIQLNKQVVVNIVSLINKLK